LHPVLIKHALNNRANSCFISQNVENKTYVDFVPRRIRNSKNKFIRDALLKSAFSFFLSRKARRKKEERSHEGYRLSFFAIAGRIVLPI